MKNQNIENVARILLSKKISFNYEDNCLRVTNQKVRYELFDIACYHSNTGKLIFQCVDYTKGISFDEFLKYFENKK